MGKRERGGVMRGMRNLLGILVMLALMGVVGFLLCERHHRQYRLAMHLGNLRVERGLFMPMGFGPYDPETEALREAYAPIEVPEGERVVTGEVFDERGDADRALFDLLSAWAKQRLDSPDTATAAQAGRYVKRLEILPGLSEDQRLQLRGLRASVAFRQGARLLDAVVTQLRRAQEAFALSIALGTPRVAEAQRWIGEIDRRIALYRELPAAEPKPAAPVQ